MDVVLVVSAGEAEQRMRVLRRPGMTEPKLASILARQLPDSTKRKRADVVLETGLGKVTNPICIYTYTHIYLSICLSIYLSIYT